MHPMSQWKSPFLMCPDHFHPAQEKQANIAVYNIGISQTKRDADGMMKEKRVVCNRNRGRRYPSCIDTMLEYVVVRVS